MKKLVSTVGIGEGGIPGGKKPNNQKLTQHLERVHVHLMNEGESGVEKSGSSTISNINDDSSKRIGGELLSSSSSGSTINNSNSNNGNALLPAAMVSSIMEMAILSDVNKIESGGEVPNIPFALLSSWTNDFSPERKLGEGGFGEVFLGKAMDATEGIERRFAVKRASPMLQQMTSHSQSHSGGAGSAESQMREMVLSVRREINVLKSFRHPNIIRLLGYSIPVVDSSKAPQLCLVYELAARGGLDRHLLDDALARELSWGRRVRVLHGSACALSCFHSRGDLNVSGGGSALHRDVKSANIALSEDYTAKLIDCGLSKFVPKDTAASALLMTVQTGVNQAFGTRGYQVIIVLCNHLSFSLKKAAGVCIIYYYYYYHFLNDSMLFYF